MSVDASGGRASDRVPPGLPRLAEPPTAASQSHVASDFVPTLPPRVPAAQPAILPPSVATTDHVPQRPPVHPRRRPASPWWHTVVRSVIVIALGAAAAAAVYMVAQGFRSYDDLPVYDAAAPSYGTVVVDISTRDAASASTVRLTAGGEGTQWQMDVSDGSLQSDGTNVWVADGMGGWVATAAPPDLMWMAQGYGRVLTYAAVVPSGARQYFEVLDRTDVVVGGRSLERIELAVAERRFAVERPSVYADWLGGGDGVGAPEVAALVLDVDENGVVWRLASGTAESALQFEVVLVSFDQAPFVIDASSALVPSGAPSSIQP